MYEVKLSAAIPCGAIVFSPSHFPREMLPIRAKKGRADSLSALSKRYSPVHFVHFGV